MSREAMTTGGLDSIRNQLKNLKNESNDVLDEMKEVRDKSLSSEDTTEIHQYTQRYETLKNQISKLNDIVNNCVIVDVKNVPKDKIQFGSIVTIYDIDDDKEITYQILGTYETDPKRGIISYTSPIGKAMIGLRVDDSFEVNIGGNYKEFEIISIDSGYLL